MKLSIITPVYNRADCVARCMESVVRQIACGTDFEHIIVDDGSVDETSEIVRQYTVKYSHINFIKFPQNRGTNAARNAAIAVAKGDFGIFLDSDDYFVDDAIRFVLSIIGQYSGYRHYMFAPDDMQKKYELNPLLHFDQAEVKYEDFLTRKIVGDFIHVVATDILKKYPFDEDLKIYEGVFFLRFFKEARKILFTNRVVTVRERSRIDSVTRGYFKNNKSSIMKSYKATQIRIDWFRQDYIHYNAIVELCSLYKEQALNCLLLAKYKEGEVFLNEIVQRQEKVPYKIRILYSLHLGKLYKLGVYVYLTCKYEILKMKLK